MRNFLSNNQNLQAQQALKLSIINYVNANANQKNTARNRLISSINRVIQTARPRRLPVSSPNTGGGGGNNRPPNTSGGGGNNRPPNTSGGGGNNRPPQYVTPTPSVNTEVLARAAMNAANATLRYINAQTLTNTRINEANKSIQNAKNKIQKAKNAGVNVTNHERKVANAQKKVNNARRARGVEEQVEEIYGGPRNIVPLN